MGVGGLADLLVAAARELRLADAELIAQTIDGLEQAIESVRQAEAAVKLELARRGDLVERSPHDLVERASVSIAAALVALGHHYDAWERVRG